MIKKDTLVVRTKYYDKSYNFKTTVGYMFLTLQDDSERAYYEKHSSIQEGSFRLATPDEEHWFYTGITNINDIPKKSFNIYF